MTWRLAWLSAFVLVTTAACGGSGGDLPGPATTTSATTATVAPGTTGTTADVEPKPGTRYGVAGLIPPHWPNSSDADWAALFSTLPETGALVGAYQHWESAEEAVAVTFQVADQNGLIPVVGLGVKVDTGAGIDIALDLADPAARQRFVDEAVRIVKKYDIQYLQVDTEVNRIEAEDPVAFDGFVTLYAETYDAVKAVSPETLVFTGFQLEMLRGAATLTGRQWAERWDLIERFGDRLDLVAFTTYPFFDYEDPGAIPADYYAEAAAHAGGRSIAFTEIGWPSAPLVSAPASGYGGSPEEQAAFVRRFAELTDGMDVRLALWSFPYDLGPAGPPPFESVSLRENGGAAKPALAEWLALATR